MGDTFPGEVRCDFDRRQVGHGVVRAGGFVRAQGRTGRGEAARRHLERGVPFGGVGGEAYLVSDEKAATVLHPGMAHAAELGGLALAVLVQPSLEELDTRSSRVLPPTLREVGCRGRVWAVASGGWPNRIARGFSTGC